MEKWCPFMKKEEKNVEKAMIVNAYNEGVLKKGICDTGLSQRERGHEVSLY